MKNSILKRSKTVPMKIKLHVSWKAFLIKLRKSIVIRLLPKDALIIVRAAIENAEYQDEHWHDEDTAQLILDELCGIERLDDRYWQ
ncbi:hypothetical protein UFOVP1605_54 [uncultured Caudovirales phage]|uniref:Uncharacterized protein n=1 Tax=uncultured Caudovirales phage TaxID=2100421 RepID=A0A6J5STK7_9CAUD|nr:hypothetical protein UFOVP1605_54 [uncultured Caudovirales phage]